MGRRWRGYQPHAILAAGVTGMSALSLLHGNHGQRMTVIGAAILIAVAGLLAAGVSLTAADRRPAVTFTLLVMPVMFGLLAVVAAVSKFPYAEDHPAWLFGVYAAGAAATLGALDVRLKVSVNRLVVLGGLLGSCSLAAAALVGAEYLRGLSALV